MRRLTYANVMSTLAFFIAMGGTAVAVDGSLPGQNTVGSSDIMPSEVYGSDVRTNQIHSADVRDDTLANGGLAAADLQAGSVGTSELADGSLETRDISDPVYDPGGFLGGIRGSKIVPGTINESHIQGGLAIRGREVRTSAGVSAPQNTYTSASVDCSSPSSGPRMRVIGGGYYTNAPVRVMRSFPHDEDTWRVEVYNDLTPTGAYVEAWAVCALSH